MKRFPAVDIAADFLENFEHSVPDMAQAVGAASRLFCRVATAADYGRWREDMDNFAKDVARLGGHSDHAIGARNMGIRTVRGLREAAMKQDK